MSCHLLFCLLLLAPYPTPLSPARNRSPPLSQSLSLHQVWERGDLRGVNLPRRAWETGAQAPGGSCVLRPLTAPTRPGLGPGLQSPGAPGRSRRRARPCESSSRLSQTTVAVLEELWRLQHSFRGGCTPAESCPLSTRAGGLAERGAAFRVGSEAWTPFPSPSHVNTVASRASFPPSLGRQSA